MVSIAFQTKEIIKTTLITHVPEYFHKVAAQIAEIFADKILTDDMIDKKIFSALVAAEVNVIALPSVGSMIRALLLKYCVKGQIK